MEVLYQCEVRGGADPHFYLSPASYRYRFDVPPISRVGFLDTRNRRIDVLCARCFGGISLPRLLLRQLFCWREEVVFATLAPPSPPS